MVVVRRLYLNETEGLLCSQNVYISNLTLSYYTDQSKASTIAPAASVVIFVLAGLIFNLKILSAFSNVSAILDPKARLFISPTLSLFLPVASYIFATANNSASCSNAAAPVVDLSLRAGLILTWMFLVELLRNKVEEIRMGGYSSAIQRAGRVVWMGSLVFFNIQSAGRKAVFSVLWVLCATKMAQRVALSEAWKRSYASGRNDSILTSYMAQMLLAQRRHERRRRRQEHHHPGRPGRDGEHHDIEQCTAGTAQLVGENGDELMKRCNYVVMGEDKLVKEATADGYVFINEVTTSTDDVITVGKVWELPETTSSDSEPTLLGIRGLKRLCLSFALFKLLRRRLFGHLPELTDEEVHDCRNLILNGLLYNINGEESNAAEALFQVMNDEVHFLSEYYNSFIPVVFASPFFLLVNYFLLPVFVTAVCFMSIVICGNGDVGYVFSSIRTENYTLRSGVSEIVLCLVARAANISDPPSFLSLIDLSATIFLFIIVCYVEIWEFLVFLLSNWFTVSVLCSYTAKRHCRSNSSSVTLFFRGLLWLRSKMLSRHRSLRRLKQLSVLNLRWPLLLPLFAPLSLAVRTESAASGLKQSIVDCLVEHDRRCTPLSNGKSALDKHHLSTQLAWACDRSRHGVAEVILTWHVATSILEVERRPPSNKDDKAASSTSKVASQLSKYCAYLVAFHPELLPDNKEKAERVFEDMRAELKVMLGCPAYFLSCKRTRVKKIMASSSSRSSSISTGGDNDNNNEREIRVATETTSAAGQSGDDEDNETAAAGHHSDQNKVVLNGAKLAKLLMDGIADHETVWKVLADVWTELIVYAAPSNDEERVKGHHEALVEGGELITVLWALTTHIGVTRRPPTKQSMETDCHPDA